MIYYIIIQFYNIDLSSNIILLYLSLLLDILLDLYSKLTELIFDQYEGQLVNRYFIFSKHKMHLEK
jgi:hypothetical protein